MYCNILKQNRDVSRLTETEQIDGTLLQKLEYVWSLGHVWALRRLRLSHLVIKLEHIELIYNFIYIYFYKLII
jgi:hypothetical protein